MMTDEADVEQPKRLPNYLLDAAGISIERMPMLNVIFDRMAASCTDSLQPMAGTPCYFSVNGITNDRVGDIIKDYEANAVAAVLGVIKAMGAIDQSPKILGGFIGAALVGTFAGIFLSYGIISPFALKIKMTREKRCRPYIIVKQTLLAFMNGAMPQIAVEHGRKMIASTERPSIDVVENETIAGPARVAAVEPEPKAARA